MELPTPGAIAYRTPAELERGMVIVPPDTDRRETVRRTRFVLGRWTVRTNTNIYRIHPLTQVRVVAEFVPGVGWVTDQAVAS